MSESRRLGVGVDSELLVRSSEKRCCVARFALPGAMSVGALALTPRTLGKLGSGQSKQHSTFSSSHFIDNIIKISHILRFILIIYSFFQIFDYHETGQKTTALIKTPTRRRTARASLSPLEEDRCTNDHVSTLSGLGAGTGL